MSRPEEFPEIGKVQLRKTKKARRVSINVKPFEGVIVSIPYRVSFESARRILMEHKGWVVKRLAAVRSEESAVSHDLSQGKVIVTRKHTMRAVACDTEAASWTLKNGALTIYYPQETCLTDPSALHAVRSGLIAAYRAEAKMLLPARVAYWAERFGFTYSRVTVKNMRSRWGSCSGRNIINLNLHLMRLNDSLIDYVILHELVHTRIRNHSAAFWKHLQAHIGNAKELDTQLRKQSIAFF